MHELNLIYLAYYLVVTETKINGIQANTNGILICWQYWVNEFVVPIFQLPDFSFSITKSRINNQLFLSQLFKATLTLM